MTTTSSGTIGEPRLQPAVGLSMSVKTLKRRKSLTRLFAAASRKSSPTTPSLNDGYIPPTPQVPTEHSKRMRKMSAPSSAQGGDFILGKDEDKVQPGVAENLVGLGILEAEAKRQPLQVKKRRNVRQLSLRDTRQTSLTAGEDEQRPHTATMDHSGSGGASALQNSSTRLLRKSKSTKTSLRTTSAYTSPLQSRGISVDVTKTKGSPALLQLSRPSTSGATFRLPKPAKTPSRHGDSSGYDDTLTACSDLDRLPPSPQRPWQATYSDAEVRSSFRSALTAVSSRTNTTSTTRSSVMTKDTSITDVTIDSHSRPGSKSGDGIMTVDEAIDMYAAGFTDDVEEEAGESRDTSLSDEERRRSIRIAEAISDNMGSPVSARPSTGRSSISNTLISRGPPAPSTPLTGSRDQHGFLKSSHYITRAQYDAWSADYLPIQERRTNKWTSYMRESGLSPHHPIRFPSRSAKTQRYIRKGIPPAWRGAVWFYYAGGDAYLSRHPQLYNNLVHLSDSNLHENEKESIERDLHRTFPDNIQFKPEPNAKTITNNETLLLSSLRRVLRAFALHNPKIGYCQSLNFIAALLLLFLPEEKAFWMLHIVTKVYLPGTHEMSLEGANVDLWVLTVALKNTLPSVWAKVGAAGAGNESDGGAKLPPISLCTTSWFMSLFIGTLPIETVLRVWDVLFYEGSRTLFRVALTIFKLGEQRIKSVTDSMELFQLVQGLPRGMIDAGKFMDIANRKGGVGADWVERRRGERRIWFAKERQRKMRSGDLAPPEANEEDQTQEKVVVRKASVWRRKKPHELAR
ncbi:MAG: hypothetical protein Q9217_001240 [Psora testacea]